MFYGQGLLGSEKLPLLCSVINTERRGGLVTSGCSAIPSVPPNRMSMDSDSLCITRPPPEIGEAPGKRLKSEPKTPLESKREEDMDESDFHRMYGDSEEPFYYQRNRFVYRNNARIRLDEEIEKAMAEYKRERSKNPSPFDAIAPPAIARLCGCIRPLTITDDIRPLLIRLCNLALDKYNAETENQGANFVFDDLVKSTYGSCAGTMYYITFQAKSKDDTHTFQAQVWKRLAADGPPVVKSCSMKPT